MNEENPSNYHRNVIIVIMIIIIITGVIHFIFIMLSLYLKPDQHVYMSSSSRPRSGLDSIFGQDYIIGSTWQLRALGGLGSPRLLQMALLLLPSIVFYVNLTHCAVFFVPLLDVEHGGDDEEESFSSHNIDISHKSQYLRRLTLKGRE